MAFVPPEARGKEEAFVPPEARQKPFVPPEAREEPKLADTVTGFAADIAISESSRLAGAAAGAAIGSFVPVVGTAAGAAIGYVIGGLGGGALGSKVRQNIERPDEELDQGQMFADALINLVPGGKGGKIFTRVAQQAGIGAGISSGAEVVESIVNKEKLPTLDELAKAGLSGAVLGGGLGVTGEVFTKAYTKFAGMPTRDLTLAFRKGDPDAKIMIDGTEKTAQQFADDVAKKYKEIGINIREKYDDEFIRAKMLQDISAGGQLKTEGGKLKVTADEMDYYLQRRLAEGKIDAKLQRVEDEINVDASFLTQKADELGTETSQLSKDINQYLYAKHALDYNKANKSKYGGDGAAGISTDEAKSIVKKFEDSGLDKTLDVSIDNRRKLSREILDTIEEGGLISAEKANKLREEFPDYVPLNRIMDTDEVQDAQRILTSSSTRYETLSTGVRRARGSGREVNDISQNIVDNLAGAIRRSEVNKANISFVKLLMNNKKAAKDMGIRVRKPKKIGTQLVKDTSEEAEFARAEGKKPKQKRVPIYEKADNNVVTVFINGERRFVEFTDPSLARVFKGQNRQEIGSLMKGLYGLNRFLGGIYTRLSPEFIIPNLFRDRSEALVNNLAKMRGLTAIKTLNPINDMRTIRRNLFGGAADTPKQQELDRLYKQFIADGGSTGGLGLDTIKDIEKRMDELSGNLRAPTKNKVKALNEWVNKVNELVEDSTRFGTYRRGLESGMTRDQAALAARNSSFDPKLRGTEADVIKALYLFSNPAIQGAKNFLRSMFQNPAKGAGVMAGLVTISTAIDKYNSMIDEDYRQKIPKWKIDKHLTFVKSVNEDGSLNYFSIPIGYSMVPFKMAADLLQRVVRGDKEIDNVDKVSSDFFQSVFDSYNPMGGSPVPTVLRPMVELMTNKDGLGRDIRPKWLETKNISATEKVFPWTADTQGGELAMSLADQLEDMGYEVSPENLLYLYQTYTGGPGQTVKRLLNLTSKMYRGEEVDRDDVPILRRFYGKTYADVFERRVGDRLNISAYERQDDTASAQASRIAYQIMKRYEEASDADKFTVLVQQLNRPDVNSAVRKRVERELKDIEKGITSLDKGVRQLSVARRAEYYKDKIETLEPQKILPYISDQMQKGVMSKKVIDTLKDTEEFKRFFGQ